MGNCRKWGSNERSAVVDGRGRELLSILISCTYVGYIGIAFLTGFSDLLDYDLVNIADHPLLNL